MSVLYVGHTAEHHVAAMLAVYEAGHQLGCPPPDIDRTHGTLVSAG
jgi:hypothetical protein